MTLAERLREQGREEGRDEGRKQGRDEGRRRTLLLQLHLKFAKGQSLPETVVGRVEAGTEAELERWSERFVFAVTLEQIFDASPLD